MENPVNPSLQIESQPLNSAPPESLGESIRHIRFQFNLPRRQYPPGRCLHEWFAGQAAKSPNAVAVTFENQSLTYRELDEQANQLAHYLRELGVGPDRLAALHLERGPAMIIGVVAILKAGGAYVPLDPAYPKERLGLMLEDARPLAVLTQNKLTDRLPDSHARVICLDDPASRDWETRPVTPPENRSRPGDLAYVIFTSGSTGRPKGVLITHYNVVRLLQAAAPGFHFDASDVWTLFHSYAFDFSVWEIWGALLYGGRLVVVPYFTSRSPRAFYELLRAEGVTVLNQTPGAFLQLAQAEAEIPAPGPLALRLVIFGGEALALSSLQSWFARHGDQRPQLVNMYGITETTVHVTCRHIRRTDVGLPSVIGTPLPDLEIYLLDAQGRKVADGETGEIYVGGAGLGRGYLNQPELTAERFLPHPFNTTPGERLYRSGDLARRRPDGDLEYLGRADNQIKIRGHRIELGEIEAALAGHPRISAGAVVAQQWEGEPALVAFVVGRDGPAPRVATLRQWLMERIPVYMIPVRFVEVSALPLNNNGKVDQTALARLDGVEVGTGTEYVAPRDDLERTLAEIWKSVLRRKRVGVQDNFFDLGGHSLLAVGICSQIASRLQFEVPLRWVFEQPTIRHLAGKLRSPAGTASIGLAIPPADRSRPLPMSFGQQQMWLLHQSLPDPAIYNQPVACHLTGRVDREKVRRALELVQDRHEVLRTALRESGSDLVQVVTPAGQAILPWQELDLTGVPADQQAAVWQASLLGESRRPFDLAQAPLWRVHWLKLAETRHILAFIFHHAIIDEWSLRLLVRELELSYRSGGSLATATLPALAVQYADFAVWQNRQLSASRAEELRRYWQEQLQDLPPPMELPADRPKPLHPSGGGAIHHFQIHGPTVSGLRQLARQEKTTLFTVVLAAWQLWLHRYTGQTDLLVGIPVALRERPEVQPLLGYFLNSLPVRARISGSQSFQELVGHARDTLLGGFSHADLPIDKIAELAGKPFGSGQAGLFQVMFVLLEEGLPPLWLDQAVGQWVSLGTHTSKNDLLLSVQAGETVWECQLEYATDRFTAERAARLARHLTELLGSIVAAPLTPVNQLNFLPATEHRHILEAGKGPEIACPTNQCVHQLFEAQAAQTPEAAALIFEHETLTYGKLNQRANQLARHLRSRDVGPDTLVGLCVERSLEMFIGVLGILKAGAAYVPLDTSLPPQRLSYLISNAECGVVITQEAHMEWLRTCLAEIKPAPLLVLLPTAIRETRAADAANPAPLAQPHHLAYVLYTSGSTGRPKGVEMPHGPLVNLIHWQRSISAMGFGDRTLQFASLGFDVSFQEMFATWASGGTLVVAPQELRIHPAGLLAAMEDWRINRLFLPFVMLEQLAGADLARPTPLTHLKEVSVAGEQLRIGPAIRRFFARLPGSRLWNHYGPAEAHVVTSHELGGPPAAWPDLPAIGRPLPNCEILLLDDQRQLVPAGVMGEIYIGGKCLARGYRQRPDLTGERFVSHPFNAEPGARLYRTGDLGRRQGDGTLEFLGRADHQVKLRGFRVELGEIESVLGGHPAVTSCVVVAEESANGEKALAAYVVARHGAILAGGALRTWLKEKLPDYMIPARLVAVPALPLNANGKVERMALRQLAGVELAVEHDWQMPASERERVLVEIWQASLRREPVGVQDNFFDLGGHSLLAAVICSQINQRLGLTVPLRWIFEDPTIARLAKRMDSLSSNTGSVATISRVERREQLPMSFAQQGMWLLHHTLADPATYNQPYVCRLAGRVDPELLRACLRVIQGRHEVLRTALALDGENLVQAVAELATAPLPWQEFDQSEIPVAGQSSGLSALLTSEGRRPFALDRAPLWRAAWITLGPEDHVLLLTFHHAIIDEWSLRRLFQELEQLYGANGDSGRAGLLELPMQYADFAVWQRDQLSGPAGTAQLEYWRTQLQDLPPALELPGDLARPPNPSGRGATAHFEISGPVVSLVRDLARQENASLFTVMLAAFHVWLHRLTGQTDLLVGTPVANRERPEVQPLVGFFLNTVPIRARLSGAPAFRDVVRQMRETVLAAFDHGHLPFEKMVEISRRHRVVGQQPLFETMFVLVEETPPPLRLPAATGHWAVVPTHTAKNDLMLSVAAGDQVWECEFEYSTDLFTPERINYLAGQFGELLNLLAAQPATPVSQLDCRGSRIEAETITTTLRSHPHVAGSVAELEPGAWNGTGLTIYVELRSADATNVPALRAWLAAKLPDHQMPARWVILPALPLSPEGRLDRRALAALAVREPATVTKPTAPRDERERVLVEIWQELLRRDHVSVQDDFFDLGGHSLLVAILCARIAQRLHLEVPLLWVFENPTVAKLAGRLAALQNQPGPTGAITRADRRQPLPMSFGQRGMWLLHQTHSHPAAYHVTTAFRFSGPVDGTIVRRCLQVIQNRHEVLRTALVERGTDLVQEVAAAAATPVPWQQLDLTAGASGQMPADWEAWWLTESLRRFDLAQAPLWRAAWITTGKDEHLLALCFHHGIVDEWSLRLLLRELEQLYVTNGETDPAGLAELPVQYADYAVWERARLSGTEWARHRDFWQAELRDLPAPLELPADLVCRRPRSGRGAVCEFHVSGPVPAALRDLARKEKTTLFTLGLAAYVVWLHRHTGQSDVIVGTPAANRERPETQSLIGYFLNTLPIRARLAGGQDFLTVLGQVRQSLLKAFSHASLPFEQMVDLTVRDGGGGHAPVYQVMFVFLEEGLPELRLGQSVSTVAPTPGLTSKHDLILSIQSTENVWHCQFEYASDLFSSGCVARLAAHFTELLTAIAARPRAPICQLNLLAPAERRQILEEWNRTERDYPRQKSVPELFVEQVARTPESVALICGEHFLTYQELNRQARQLARHLRDQGMETGEVVGLSVERSVAMVIGILGILLAGGAYWALEEHLPEERLRLMLDEARPRVLVGSRKSAGHLLRLAESATGGMAASVVVIEELLEKPESAPGTTDHWPNAEDPAYVSYTSGSTGRPKGVVVPHRGVARLVCGADYASLSDREVFLQLSPVAFDASTFEIWGALLNGGRLVLMPPGPPALSEIARAIQHYGVTTLWLTAGLFHLMVDEQLAALAPLRQLLAGGDVLSPEHVRQARRALPGCRIINGYGPTENTTFTCCHTVGDEDAIAGSIPIGRPIANTRVYVLDSEGGLVPAWVAGELYAGGDGVARGYLNQPELTAEKFVPDPFSRRPGDRLYRTGDRVRWRDDGTLEFLGRADAQIKIRGYRIELGEIEAVLISQREIATAVVLARESLPGDKQLVAYLVPRTPDRPDPATLRGRLAGKLPDYMVPARFVWLDQLPLTANGKVDRRALPAPAASDPGQARPPDRPGNLLEMELTRIWQRLFKREDIGPQDNFFALGGHSLQAVRLAAEIDKLTGCKLPIAALFQSPTIESLARRLTDEHWAPPWSSLVPLQPRGSKPPLFFLHGLGGNVYGFVEMAGLLGPDQPVYGIQAVGLDGRCPRHVSVEEMAAHYVKEITSFQPHGPVYLSGYSLGGLIAWEVSCQLQRAGRTVAFLGLLDSCPIGGVPWIFYTLVMVSYLPRRSLVHLRNWWGLPFREKFQYLAGRYHALVFWWRDNQTSPALVSATPMVSADRPKIQGHDYYVAVAMSYRLKSHPGPASVFFSDQAMSGWRWYWRYMARGGASFHPVPGGHLDILKPPYLSVLATTLKSVINQKQAAAASLPPAGGSPHATPAK